MNELRTTVTTLKRKDFSERQACKLVGINLSTHRYKSHPMYREISEKELIREIKKLAYKRRRFGTPRIQALLKKKYGVGKINHKRTERIWAELGLTLPKKRPRKRKILNYAWGFTRATHPNHVWSYDFQSDALQSGRKLKFFNVVDEFTKDPLAIRPEHSVRA